MLTEIVYLGRDNRSDLLLKANGAAVDLASVTRIDLVVGGLTISSGNADGDPIRWAGEGFVTGEVRMSLGGEALEEAAAATPATLIVFDTGDPDGIVWGKVNLLVMGPNG